MNIGVLLFGYIVGCLQTSYLLCKYIKKIDIREKGNGNAGASNTTVALGWKYGIAVGVIDILKAVFALLVIRIWLQGTVSPDQLQIYLYLCGLGVILGHNFPFFMGFRGGKGTASTVGMLFVIHPLMGLIGIIIIIAVALGINYIALGTISLVIYFVAATFYLDYPLICKVVAIIIALMSIYKHRENVVKICRGQEKKVRDTMKK